MPFTAEQARELRRRVMARIAHLLVQPCLYCGAAIGEVCRSKTGRAIYQIGQIHDARLTGCAFARYRRFKQKETDSADIQET